MVRRVARLVVAEGIKLGSHPFLYIAAPLLIVGTAGWAYLRPILQGPRESEFAKFNSYQLFSYGSNLGMLIASCILVFFTSMLFSGEYDRGTIKNLLTRPVTRTDVFLSKVVIALLLALGLYAIVLYVSSLYGVARGDLGAVWDTQIYDMKRTASQMQRYTVQTILVSFLPLLAAGFLGILISNLIESSGYAAATAVIIYILLYLVTTFFMPERLQVKFFTFYLTDGVDILRRYAEGEGTLGYEPGHEAEWFRDKLFLKVPLLYMGGFLAVAYGVFRAKNIHA